MARRIFLFLLLNFLVITVITLIFQFFGIGSYTSEYGLDYTGLMIFCLVWAWVVR